MWFGMESPCKVRNIQALVSFRHPVLKFRPDNHRQAYVPVSGFNSYISCPICMHTHSKVVGETKILRRGNIIHDVQ